MVNHQLEHFCRVCVVRVNIIVFGCASAIATSGMEVAYSFSTVKWGNLDTISGQYYNLDYVENIIHVLPSQLVVEATSLSTCTDYSKHKFPI